jgi:hypothetical protein
VLGICYPQSAVPEKNGARSLVTVPRYSDVSVNIAMYTLYNNIVFDTFSFWHMCGLPGTHMISLVLFFRKPGVTEWYQSGVDCRMYAK